MRAWDGDFFSEAIYFTSEAEAREGESGMVAEVGEEFHEYMSLMETSCTSTLVTLGWGAPRPEGSCPDDGRLRGRRLGVLEPLRH
ncbi:MAG TPA: hypothetical protein VG078_11610 [Acidimicrobiales bacterium]|nr:hypothetical protein [Acidimicrobiales bacterium]